MTSLLQSLSKKNFKICCLTFIVKKCNLQHNIQKQKAKFSLHNHMGHGIHSKNTTWRWNKISLENSLAKTKTQRNTVTPNMFFLKCSQVMIQQFQSFCQRMVYLGRWWKHVWCKWFQAARLSECFPFSLYMTLNWTLYDTELNQTATSDKVEEITVIMEKTLTWKSFTACQQLSYGNKLVQGDMDYHFCQFLMKSWVHVMKTFGEAILDDSRNTFEKKRKFWSNYGNWCQDWKNRYDWRLMS